MFAVVRSTLSLKIASIGQISLIEQPWQSATNGEPIYFSLIFVYLPLQIVSMLLPTFLQWKRQKGKILTEAQKKTRRRGFIMQGVMAVVFIFFVASVASGVAIYWIFSSGFQIFQTLFFHYINRRQARRGMQEQQRRLRQSKKQLAFSKK
jgi:YidC/Oxa1 family membrane protein insertase